MDKIIKDNHISITPEEDEIGIRLDKFLSMELEDYSRSFLQNLISEGRISVNNKIVKSSYKAKAGDFIDIEIPEAQELKIEARPIPLDIVYEDSDVLIVNKPQGMVVHPAPGHLDDTLVNAIMYHCKDSLSTINGVNRPGIVHRIDKDTSGLLVICKNDNSHRELSKQFAVHSITRIYSAICYGHFSEAEGTINKALARDKNDRKRMAINPAGRHAVTHYKVIESLKNDFSYINCQLETGRTHQIRVHMKSLNHPLLGDPVYGPNKCPFKLNGQMLHAGTLGFIHPTTKEYMEFKSPLPDYFEKVLSLLRA